MPSFRDIGHLIFVRPIVEAGLGIHRFFVEINYRLLWRCVQEVLWLSVISFLPIIIAIIITAISNNSLTGSLRVNIVPGEMIAFALSFISPMLYLLVKIQGSDYKLPMIRFVSIITYVVYISTLVLYLIAKYGWVPEISDVQDQKNPDKVTLYFALSLIFLGTSIVIWIYSLYHGEASSDYSTTLRVQQQNFNQGFNQALGGQANSGTP